MKITLPPNELQERDLALLALTECDNRYRQLAEHIGDIVWLYDVETAQFLYVNSAYERLSGRSIAVLYLQPNEWFDAIHPEDRERVRESWSRVDEQFLKWDIEYRVLTLQGVILWVRDRAQGVRTPSGRTIRIVGHMDDITALKAAENRLRHLSLALDSIANQERREIAEGLHDHVCQTLAVALLHAGMLGSSADPDTRQASQSLSELLTTVVSSIRSLTFQLVPPSLMAMGHWAALMSVAPDLERQFQVELDFENDAGDVDLDDGIEASLFRSIRELVINAGKHARARHIRVQRETRDGFLKFTVSDDGCGIALDGAARNEGIGLLLVRERMVAIGGRMEFDATPRKGTRINLFVPLASGSDTED